TEAGPGAAVGGTAGAGRAAAAGAGAASAELGAAGAAVGAGAGKSISIASASGAAGRSGAGERKLIARASPPTARPIPAPASTSGGWIWARRSRRVRRQGRCPMVRQFYAAE